MLQQKRGIDLNLLQQKRGIDLNLLQQKRGIDLNLLQQKGGTDLKLLQQKRGIDLNLLQRGGVNAERCEGAAGCAPQPSLPGHNGRGRGPDTHMAVPLTPTVSARSWLCCNSTDISE